MNEQTALKTNPLIETLIDVGKGEELTYLEGYIGPSDSGVVRLYGNLNLTYYADIPREDILHARNIPGDTNGLTQVFMTLNTKIRLYSTRNQKSGSVLAKAIHPNEPDLDFCLVQCAMDHDVPSDSYDKCAEGCEGKFPINKIGLFAQR